MELRPYQSEAVDRTLSALKEHRSALICMPTGTGKTIVFSHLAKMESEGLVLVVAPTDELCDQAMGKIEAVTGKRPGLEKAESRCLYKDVLFGNDRVVVTSVQTQDSGSSYKRMKNFDPRDFSLVIIDEAHLSITPSYMRMIAHYMSNPRCRLVGVTATPMRHDKRAMGSLYETVSYSYSLVDAIEDGWLVPLRRTAVKIDGLDLTHIKARDQDFTHKDLSPALEKPDVIAHTADAIVKYDKGRKNIVFTTTVRHASKLCEKVNELDPGSSAYVYGTMKERDEVIDGYRRGRYRRIFNAQVLSHGFDDPETSVVTLTAPSKSVPAITQKIGRGTRVLPGVIDGYPHSKSLRVDFIKTSRKPYLEVIDMIGNAGVHKTVDEFDILGGEYGDWVVSRARKNSGSKTVDVNEALIEARKQHRVHINSQRHRSLPADPFISSKGPPVIKNVARPVPTEKMANVLLRFGFDPNKTSFNQARMLIGMLSGNQWRPLENPPAFARRCMQ